MKTFASNSSIENAYRTRLFVDDAEAGFAFIDVCRQRFDVVLMNPPFGDSSLPSKPYIEETYGDTKGDVFKAFVECFQDRLVPCGMLGIISSRTGFFLSTAEDWRQRIVLRLYRPMLIADLGFGVLDAKVETAAYVLRSLSAVEEVQLTESLVPELAKVTRKAPVYWQLGTQSASYSIWLYYHRLGRDTFFQVLNEYVKPKLKHEQKILERMQSESGTEPSREQRKEIEDQEKFVAEIATMAEEVERIAPLWNPHFNDGVIINYAPLWRLVLQNKPWQKECKSCWDKLAKGDFDWAHLAMHLWPERVVPKCVTDASLAIAHGLEEIFWEQDERNRWEPKKEPDEGWQAVIDRLVKERTSPAVKAALKSLLDAPSTTGSSTRSRRRTRASA